jgi:hypothetical protein
MTRILSLSRDIHRGLCVSFLFRDIIMVVPNNQTLSPGRVRRDSNTALLIWWLKNDDVKERRASR